MRLRIFEQYSEKLLERFPDLKININDKMDRTQRQWNYLESRLIDYLDDNFDRILHGKMIREINQYQLLIFLRNA